MNIWQQIPLILSPFPSFKSVKATRSRYEVYLNKQAEAKTVNTKELKRKIICDEIVAVRQKKACYEECIKRNALYVLTWKNRNLL